MNRNANQELQNLNEGQSITHLLHRPVVKIALFVILLIIGGFFFFNNPMAQEKALDCSVGIENMEFMIGTWTGEIEAQEEGEAEPSEIGEIYSLVVDTSEEDEATIVGTFRGSYYGLPYNGKWEITRRSDSAILHDNEKIGEVEASNHRYKAWWFDNLSNDTTYMSGNFIADGCLFMGARSYDKDYFNGNLFHRVSDHSFYHSVELMRSDGSEIVEPIFHKTLLTRK